MIDITEKIYSKVKSSIDTWSEADIYAISFFVIFIAIFINTPCQIQGYRLVVIYHKNGKKSIPKVIIP